ncbi:hypothetical protein G6F57_015317 [Rhizopus arrhizus]|jgi:hypothetical protein|uniref:Secreted protein n=1 Tax=Rhizopus oryzae TaxID=64495 RepID=A0A9P7BKW4_RHIOR|nr:hypothetical protein G6F24_013288 [Rhizopus arrhizus]KAG1394152.1 hypothetical protein G6F58_012173 [Rhizopus delemar]KAG0775244.1 hypothetical protein G6F22_013447 [Rhizopus arrhizus]KAG0817149.1 hypothetical protein G6F18_012944 [Rhizopus arrhizus]KAG0821014.1 hypothetical protein G6F19_012147 [Rhizopus arrhizus]
MVVVVANILAVVAVEMVVAEVAYNGVAGYHKMVAAYHIEMAAADLIVDMQDNYMANGYSYYLYLYRIEKKHIQLLLVLLRILCL